ncbi:MAG: HDOD domain-containing protein [Rhodothermales bacterium]
MHYLYNHLRSCPLDSSYTPATQFRESPDFDLKFPPLPRTVAEVTSMIADSKESPNTPRLAEVVRADPIIASFVLRRVNSAHYGLRRSVDDVHQAVVLLGFDEVCNITLTAGMMRLKEVVASKEQASIFYEIMKSSIGAAFFAKELAAHLTLPLHSKAFIVGLQHAVGRLVLLYNRPDDYEALWFTCKDNVGPPPSDERKIFGIDHAELGGLAIEYWELPVLISELIRFYITPMHLNEQDLRTLGLVLSVAVSVTEQLCLNFRQGGDAARLSQDFFVPPTDLYLLGKMEGITPGDLIKLLRATLKPACNYIETMVHG